LPPALKPISASFTFAMPTFSLQDASTRCKTPSSQSGNVSRSRATPLKHVERAMNGDGREESRQGKQEEDKRIEPQKTPPPKNAVPLSARRLTLRVQGSPGARQDGRLLASQARRPSFQRPSPGSVAVVMQCLAAARSAAQLPMHQQLASPAVLRWFLFRARRFAKGRGLWRWGMGSQYNKTEDEILGAAPMG
jgi:hypothetical protein